MIEFTLTVGRGYVLDFTTVNLPPKLKFLPLVIFIIFRFFMKPVNVFSGVVMQYCLMQEKYLCEVGHMRNFPYI